MVRFTDANQTGPIGFGGDRQDDRTAQFESSAGYMLSKRLLIGAEYRTRPDNATTDPRISDMFRGHDIVGLRRTLKEQVCYLLGGSCTYTGRSMRAAHQDMGVQTRDFNILVEHLRFAMDQERVPFGAQNRLLARLAPMRCDVVQ